MWGIKARNMGSKNERMGYRKYVCTPSQAKKNQHALHACMHVHLFLNTNLKPLSLLPSFFRVQKFVPPPIPQTRCPHFCMPYCFYASCPPMASLRREKKKRRSGIDGLTDRQASPIFDMSTNISLLHPLLLQAYNDKETGGKRIMERER